MKTTKKTQYALRSMLFLAKNRKEVSPLSVIAREESIPFDYLEKIFSKLEKKGLVVSKKGASGGYFLSKNYHNITLKDIFIATEERIAIVDCIINKCPQGNRCDAMRAWKSVNKKIERALLDVKLIDLI